MNDREKLAAWMIQFGFATGHGDTMEQLLDALGTEIVDRIECEIEAERQTCAKVAGWLWKQFEDTKKAHERHSSEPFNPGRFGFDQPMVQQSKRLHDAILARNEL